MDKDFDYDKLRSRSGIAKQENFKDYREGLPTTISLVVVDQELKVLSKAEESYLVGSVDEAERNHRLILMMMIQRVGKNLCASL